MFERFTHEARLVVCRANAEAMSLGHATLGTEHLLLSLLDPESGATSRLLTATGVDQDVVRAGIARLVCPLPGVLDQDDAAALKSIGIDLDAVLASIGADLGTAAPPPAWRGRWLARRGQRGRESHPRWTPNSKQILELSLREALRLKHNYIGAEHILLGLIREGQGLAAKILVDAGVDLEDLRRKTESEVTKAA